MQWYRRLLGLPAASIILASVHIGIAHAQQISPNNMPLIFGMNADQATQALGVPLTYVRGRPGNELYLARPNVRGSVLASRSDGLYLQFHRGRLEGWKGDWGTIRP